MEVRVSIEVVPAAPSTKLFDSIFTDTEPAGRTPGLIQGRKDLTPRNPAVGWEVSKAASAKDGSVARTEETGEQEAKLVSRREGRSPGPSINPMFEVWEVVGVKWTREKCKEAPVAWLGLSNSEANARIITQVPPFYGDPFVQKIDRDLVHRRSYACRGLEYTVQGPCRRIKRTISHDLEDASFLPDEKCLSIRATT